jgi:hypothetical protein
MLSAAFLHGGVFHLAGNMLFLWLVGCNLEDRWASALMAPTSQLDKLWLFDCDAPDEAAVVTSDLARIGIRGEALYQYASKTGTHMIVEPFDRTLLSELAAARIHANPLMLWGY